jgi:hypothetical protein
VRAAQPTPAHTDGEIMAAAGTLEYRILPARLPVLVGGR